MPRHDQPPLWTPPLAGYTLTARWVEPTRGEVLPRGWWLRSSGRLDGQTWAEAKRADEYSGLTSAELADVVAADLFVRLRL